MNCQKRGRRQVTTDLTGKFCHPDGQVKSTVEIGNVINRNLERAFDISKIYKKEHNKKREKKPRAETNRVSSPAVAHVVADVGVGIRSTCR